jgi:hypothetical protein
MENKTKIKLASAVSLKDLLEKRISKINAIILRNNSVIKGDTRNVDIPELEEERRKKSELLIELHEKILEANLRKLDGEEHSNAYYIKKKSELERERIFLQSLNVQHGKVLKGSNVIEYDALLKESEVSKRLAKVLQEIELLKNKLTLFNNTVEIELNHDPKSLDIIV